MEPVGLQRSAWCRLKVHNGQVLEQGYLGQWHIQAIATDALPTAEGGGADQQLWQRTVCICEHRCTAWPAVSATSRVAEGSTSCQAESPVPHKVRQDSLSECRSALVFTPH